MRFSDTPLWWRLLVLLVTILVLAVLYWAADAVTQALPVWGQAILAALIVVPSVGYLIWERLSNRKRLAARKELDQTRNTLPGLLRRLRAIGRGEEPD